MENTEKPGLTEAKQKFLDNADAASLSAFVRKHPISVTGAAFAAGALLALPRGEEFEKRLSAILDLALLITRKIIQTSLENLDEPEKER